MPAPRDSGKKVVLAGLLEYWADRLGPEHVHLVYIGSPDPRLSEVPAQVHRVPRPRVWEQVLSLATRTVLTGRHAIQESMLYSPRVRRRLGTVLADIDADVEVFDTIRAGQYADLLPPRPGQRRFCYLDDLFSVRYARMLTSLRENPPGTVDALGEFRSLIPRPMARLASTHTAQRVLLAVEQRLVARREVATARSGATCLLVNRDEAAELSRRAGGVDVRTVPPLVPAAEGARRYDGRPTFVVLGLLSLAHNHDAAMTFMRRVMPSVVESLPDARVHVVGREARPELVSAAAPFGDRVSFDGYVPDLDALLSGACALVSPLRFGSGVKIKVLEALARGVPVLTTDVGAEGIAAGPDAGVLVESDLARYPQVMRELTDPARNAALSAAARRHHASTYARDAAYARYDRVFGLGAVREPAGAVPSPRMPLTRPLVGGRR